MSLEPPPCYLSYNLLVAEGSVTCPDWAAADDACNSCLTRVPMASMSCSSDMDATVPSRGVVDPGGGSVTAVTPGGGGGASRSVVTP